MQKEVSPKQTAKFRVMQTCYASMYICNPGTSHTNHIK